jgi:hypothetical protein
MECECGRTPPTALWVTSAGTVYVPLRFYVCTADAGCSSNDAVGACATRHVAGAIFSPCGRGDGGSGGSGGGSGGPFGRAPRAALLTPPAIKDDDDERLQRTHADNTAEKKHARAEDGDCSSRNRSTSSSSPTNPSEQLQAKAFTAQRSSGDVAGDSTRPHCGPVLRAAHLAAARVLDLRWCGLRRVPAWLKELVLQLTCLDLSHNALVEVSAAALAHMPNLATLNLSNNALRSFLADANQPSVSGVMAVHTALCNVLAMGATAASSGVHVARLQHLDLRCNGGHVMVPPWLEHRPALVILREGADEFTSAGVVRDGVCGAVPQAGRGSSLASVSPNAGGAGGTSDISPAGAFAGAAGHGIGGGADVVSNPHMAPGGHPSLHEQLIPVATSELCRRLVDVFGADADSVASLPDRAAVMAATLRAYALKYPHLQTRGCAGRPTTRRRGVPLAPALADELLAQLRAVEWGPRQRTKLSSGEYMTLGRPVDYSVGPIGPVGAFGFVDRDPLIGAVGSGGTQGSAGDAVGSSCKPDPAGGDVGCGGAQGLASDAVGSTRADAIYTATSLVVGHEDCTAAPAVETRKQREARRVFERHRALWDAAERALASVDPGFRYTNIAVTRDFRGSPHIDHSDISFQYATSLGDFGDGRNDDDEGGGGGGDGGGGDGGEAPGHGPITGQGGSWGCGALCVEASPLDVVEVVTRNAIASVDGRFPHWVSGYAGTRFSVVWYITHGDCGTPRGDAVISVLPKRDL